MTALFDFPVPCSPFPFFQTKPAMLNPNLGPQLAQLTQGIQQHEPFRHVVIADFLSAEICTQPLVQFPLFARVDAASRKSVALYFYTRERTIKARVETHSTIYVDHPLPERFQAGTVLNKHDLIELRALLARRDQHNQRLYHNQQNLRMKLEDETAIMKARYLGRLYRLAHAPLARFRR